MSEEQLIPTPSVFGETGNFLLERELGRGGMGGVYMGRDKMLDRPVAVKVMLKEYGSDPAFVEKFKREAQAVARLIHPNIAQVYSYGIADGMPYIAMELVAGGSLDSVMRHQGANTDIPRIMKICEQVAQALRCAADQGLVHGDVKPENVLLDANGNAKLVDFGLAAMQKDTDEIWGTPYYIAPEKVRKEPVDYRADMYSLGGTIYHALCGVAPFEGDDATAVVKKRFEAPPLKPSEVRPGISPQIDFLVMKMLALNPADRYPSFEALLVDFKKVMATGLSPTGTSRIEEVAPASTGQLGGGRKLTIRHKRKLTVHGTSQLDDQGGAAEGNSDVGGQEEGEAAGPKRIRGVKKRPLVESDGSEQPPQDNLGAKIAMVIGGVIGLFVVVGLLLLWFVHSGASEAAEKRSAAVLKTQEDVRDRFTKTRNLALKAQGELFEAAAAAERECEKQTREMREILSGRYTERVIGLLQPAPSAELVKAIASTNSAAVAAVAAPAGTAAAAPAAAPAAATATNAPQPERFRPPTDEESDPNSPEGQAYAEAKAKWEAEQKEKAAQKAAVPEEPAVADAGQGAAPRADGLDDTPPQVVKKFNEMWERVYASRAAEIRLHEQFESLIQKIDKAFLDQVIEKMTLDNRQEIANLASEFNELYETARNAKDWDTVKQAATRIQNTGAQQIKSTKERLYREKLEAERQAAKKAAEEAEQQRLKDLAEEKAAKVAAEIEAAKKKFQSIIESGNIRQLDWKSARRALTNLKSEFETAEGELQIGQEMKKVDCMELMQNVLIRNLKGYTFRRAPTRDRKLKHLKDCTVVKIDASNITYVRKGSKKEMTLPWQTFIRDYHINLDEVISAFIIKNGAIGTESKNKLSPKDRYNAITGCAFILRIVCSDDPSSAIYAERLLKDATKSFPALINQTKEFFPDIDFSDVAAEAASEQL